MKRLLALLLLTGCVANPPREPVTHHTHGMPATKDRQAMWQASLKRVPLAVTAAFDQQGTLWVARVEQGQIRLSASRDRGLTFAAPVTVNAGPEHVAADGENRPKLAFGRAGEIYVSWTRSGERPFSGDVRFTRSLDGGKTFNPPVTINDDRAPISHRFDALTVTPDETVHILWLDKRDSAVAQQRNEKYTGISLYHAVSIDRGTTFSANRKVVDHSCECCRLALATDTDGITVALWRHVFPPNFRDHALRRLDGISPVRRISHENWAVDACPHHGPALTIGADGAYHMAWFSGAPDKAGLYYAYSRDRGTTTSKPVPVGSATAQAGRVALTANGRRVMLAWKEFDGQANIVRIMRSPDGGNNWSDPVTVARATSTSDHPQLLAYDGRTLLVWNTGNEELNLYWMDDASALP